MECPRSLSMVMVIIAASLWGIIELFNNQLIAAGLQPIQIAAVRSIVSSTCMVLFLLIRNPSLLKISLRDLWMFIGTGVCSIAFFNACYFTAIEYTSMSMAAVLLYTSPCFIMIMSVFLFKEKLTSYKVLALVLAFSGCVLTAGIIGGSGEISSIGLITGILAGFGYSLYTIFGTFALKKYNPLTVITYTFIFGAIALCPFSNVGGIATVAIEVPGALLNILVLGIVITVVPYMLYTEGLKGLDPSIAGVIAFVEPMVATIAGFLILHETVTMQGVAGILLILLSVILLSRSNVKTESEQSV